MTLRHLLVVALFILGVVLLEVSNEATAGAVMVSAACIIIARDLD